MEKKVDKNEFLNMVLLKLEEGKVFLGKHGLKINISLDNVRINSGSVSITVGDIYLKVDMRNSELVLNDLENHEVYIYSYANDEVKIRITQNTFYLYMQIDELKPVTQEVMLRAIEALRIPFSKREGLRIDIDLTQYHEIEYTSEDGLQLRYGVDDIQIKDDKLVMNGLAIDILNNDWFISFEKNVMSMIL
ncbi:hypothetical protein AFV1_ORF90 [Captovirus AFV1]|uniref:Uncharacterized protein ORF190 n=1 Tax=Acidianus filamentous virus 1 (isolate United States/Yellowstone) TaxID=654909 RepID=Y190_AFV1Y|nr:hypothetical protein AFV1_ORF90 [Captovirus AFV1]Q70LE9.1 RecName: Full=Uncharacterized protein ORF190 [Acidianus filamentous virus 1 (isolate Yellowstone)]CAD98931.1 hypothetical protein [Captovirus AFV1]